MKRAIALAVACALELAVPAHAEWVVTYSASGDGGGPRDGGRASGLDSFPVWQDYGTATLDGVVLVTPIDVAGPGDVVRIGTVGTEMANFGETFFAQIQGDIPQQPVTYIAGTVTMTRPDTGTMGPACCSSTAEA